MNISYKTDFNESEAKDRIDNYINKLENLQFKGNFKIQELIKSWTDNEMQYSLLLKQGSIERRIKGILRIKNKEVIISFDLPDVIKNFIKEESLMEIILLHLKKAIE